MRIVNDVIPEEKVHLAMADVKRKRLSEWQDGIANGGWYYDADSPDVSIVILNLNKPQMTIACLESIWQHTSGARFEVIVVDNGSTEDCFAELARYRGPHRLLRLSLNRFFGEGNNIGAEAARGRFLVFLNNDVIVTPQWLEPLLDAFEEDPDIGCVGPMFVYPDGVLQEAGALIDLDGSAVQIGKFQSADQKRFRVARDVDYVSAAAVMLRKEDFEAVLGFDFRYEPAYYEDCDLCLKIAAMGKRTRYEPRSRIIHHEHVTSRSETIITEQGDIVESNRVKFVQRWSHYLATGLHDGAPHTAPLVPAALGASGPVAAFFSPYNIIPGGGERFLFSVMKVFADRGYQLKLLLPERYSRLRISSVLANLGMKLPHLEIDSIRSLNRTRPDVFFALGNEIVPPHEAVGQTNIFCCQFPFPAPEVIVGERLPWFDGFGCMVCYSDFVRSEILRQISARDLPAKRVEVVPPAVGTVAPPGEKRPGMILSVGRFFEGGHCKRQDKMIEATRELVARGREVELHLVGALHPEPAHRAYLERCRQSAAGLPVTFHIDAPPHKLADLLSVASIYWHGAGLGVDVATSPERCEHFGISVIEAMNAGAVPMVVANGGPSWIVEDTVSGFHYQDLGDLVNRTESVLDMAEPDLQVLRDGAVRRAGQFSQAGFEACLNALLDDLLPGRDPCFPHDAAAPVRSESAE